MIKKVSCLVIALAMAFAMSLSAFAQADVSSNTPKPPTATTSTTVPADVKPIKTYTVQAGKSYSLPADVKQTGDSYTSSNTSILTVNSTTGGFKAITNGTAYIIISNGASKRYIKVTVGTGTAANTGTTQNTSALTGYAVTVNDKTTPATKTTSVYKNGSYVSNFLSADGKVLGSITHDTFLKIVQPKVDNGTLSGDSAETSTWLASEFNKYRGIASSSTSTQNSSSTAQNNSSYASEIVRLTNVERERNGLSPLTVNSELTSSAQQRAVEISTDFSHDGDVNQVGDYFTLSNHYKSSVSPNGAVSGWINSPGHHAQMLNPDATVIGVGVYQAPNGTWYCVQMFGEYYPE